MASLTTLLRLLDSCSVAAVRCLVSKGPSEARQVLRATAQAVPRDSIHVMSYWDIVRSFPVADDILIRSDGWFDGVTAPLERFIIVQLLEYFQPKTIVEVGTYRGTTTRLLLDNCREDATIYTIDLPLDQEFDALTAGTDERLVVHRRVGIDYRKHPRASQVVQVYGSSLESSTWTDIPDGIRFAFIDASHSYEAVKNDSERIFGLLDPEGVVLWHDYSESSSSERGVGKYIRELMATRDDIFLCSDTSLAVRIPSPQLQQSIDRVPTYFPNGDYYARYPKGPVPWMAAMRKRVNS